MGEDNFDRQFQIVVSGAERTRGILYFFCLVLITGIVFFFEDAFNTTGKRMKIMNGANVCLEQKLAAAAAVPLQGFAGRDCGFHYDYVHENYQLNLGALLGGAGLRTATNLAAVVAPLASPQAAASQKVVVSKPSGSAEDDGRFAFREQYKAVLRDYTDSLSTTVPILNIKIDRNTGLILQNSLGAIVLLVLLLSLQAEQKSLGTISRLIARDQFRGRAILDIHMFSRVSAGKMFLFSAVFLPAAMQGYRIYQDFFEDIEIVIQVYGLWKGPAYLVLEAGSLGLVLYLGWRCFFEARQLAKALADIEQRVAGW